MKEILVPLGLFAMIFGIVFISIYFGYQNRRSKIHVLEKLLDQGTATPELIEQINSGILGEPAPKSVFGKSISLILTGLALAAFFYWMSLDNDTPKFLIAIGLYPFAVGLGRLIGYYHDKKEADNKTATVK